MICGRLATDTNWLVLTARRIANPSQVLRCSLMVLLLAGAAADPCRGADVEEIVARASATIRSDWAADPDYAYIERDETVKSGKTSSKTSQVVMMDGSDYYMPIAIDDHPFSPERQKTELLKLKKEFERRKNEDAGARERRIAAYKKREDENGSLLLEFPKAFNFELLREEPMNGFPAYVLSATPKKRTGPLGLAAKVLSGMDGTVWVDSAHFHAIRGDCTVMSAVPIYGILARVLPGTHIDLELSPVTDSIWLITKFSMNLNLSKLLLFNSKETTRNTYTEYRLNSEVLDDLLAKADSR